MKSEKIFSFFLLLAALVFCISCGGKGGKYDDPDDFDAVDTEDKDNPAPVTDEDTDDNGDTEPDDSDTEPDVDDDNPEIPDDTDDNDNPRPDRDESDSDEEPVPDEDNPIEPSDTDSISHKEDSEIVCTGQTKCYNSSEEITCPSTSDEDFFGQDAQYASKGYCFPKSLDASNPQIITDNNTGLVWQRKIPATYEGCTGNDGAYCLYQQALNFCENLTLENFDDWRLPTPEEFATIIDYGRTPAINKEIFSIPNTLFRDFWTLTGLYVDFTKGSTESGDSSAKLVRCVRGDFQLPVADFTITNEGSDEEIVEDSAHNLYWTKIESEEALKWKKALNYCNKLNYGDNSGWRLPSINELASILDYSASEPASKFPSLSSTSFWSSTSYNESPDYAWRINSSNGTIETGKKTKEASVICVK
ncbi:DUF1566 domain-containing protein [bacterium]|nr:DUF1566 domain-containing protein [bacterium]